jgi:hypothetical protein
MNPLYSVGQDVAVCSLDMSVVIPATTVTEVVFIPGNVPLINQDTGTLARPLGGDAYAYRVEHGPISRVHGRSIIFAERSLRPILPGEYLESTLESHKPIEAEA